MSKKENKKQIKRIPIHFIVLPIFLLAFLAFAIAHPIVQTVNANPQKLLAPYIAGIPTSDTEYTEEQLKKIDHFENIEFIKASKLANAYVGNDSTDIKSVITTSKETKNLEVGLVAKNYRAAKTVDDKVKAGQIGFYVGFRSTLPYSSNSIKITDVQVYLADGWSGYQKKLNASIATSTTLNGENYLGNSKMHFITNLRIIDIDKDVTDSYCFGFKKVKHPSLYVYIKYTDKTYNSNNGVREYLIEYDYEDYFQKGQTAIA